MFNYYELLHIQFKLSYSNIFTHNNKIQIITHLNTNVPSQPLPNISFVLKVILPTWTFPPPTSSASAVIAKLRSPKMDRLLDREPCESCWNSRTFKVVGKQ